MKRQEATNTFQEGMVMDFNPLTTPNNVVTNCLNGTLITFNGNEYVLQNDMGNGRVETAYLPEGYVPLGTAEFGGIIYIALYNPLIDKCQVGCFPSPERNITSDEISDIGDVKFIQEEFVDETGTIKSPTIKKSLSSNIILHPGDKFLVTGNSIRDNKETISGYEGNVKVNGFIDFKLATIDDNGRFIYLDNLRKYQVSGSNKSFNIKDSSESINTDEYRQNIATDYHIFTSKVSGNLYLIGQLEVIDSISSFTWKLKSISTSKPESANIVDLNDGDYYEIEYEIHSQSETGNSMNHIILKNESNNELYISSDGSAITTETIPEENSDSITTTVWYRAKGGTETVTVIPCMKFGKLEYLQESVILDFDQLGTNQISNKLWKYYTNDSNILIKFDLQNYFIDSDIQKVSLKFLNYSSMCIDGWDSKEILTVTLPERKSYSGIHSIEVPFEKDFVKNSLYGVIIEAQMGDSTHRIYHYLYTNGIYNQYFLSAGEKDEEINFDNKYLPLNPILNFNNLLNSIVLKQSNVLEEGNSLASAVYFGNTIKGYTEYTANGSNKIETSIKLEKEYNTFSINSDKVDVSYDSEENIAEIDNSKFDDVNTSETQIDPDYINGFIDTRENIIITINDGYIHYDINIKSPIAASVVSRSVSVNNYYAPVLNTPDDLYKYGLDSNFVIEDGIETLKSISMRMGTLPAIGMSGGGTDNQGGGGIRYVSGIATIDDTKDVNGVLEESDNYSIVGSSLSEFGTQGPGEPGIFTFPNDYVNKAINLTGQNCSIVPVILLNAGTSRVKYGGVVYSFISGGDRGKDSDKRVTWFNDPDFTCTFFTYLFFIKEKGSDNYIPINWFMKVNKQSDLSDNFRGINRYLSLLHALYAKRPFEDTINVYTVGNISYRNKYPTATLGVKAHVKDSSLGISFKGQNLSDLRNNLPNGENLHCFQTNFQSDFIIHGKIIFNFDILNKYLDTFLEYQNSNQISSFVQGGIIQAPNSTASSLLYIQQDSSLIPLPKLTSVKQVDKFKYDIIEGNTIITVDQFASENCTYDNLDILNYDVRDDMLNVVSSKLNQALKLEWQCHNGSKGGATQMTSKGLSTKDYINVALKT